jgi:hypothetical protein
MKMNSGLVLVAGLALCAISAQTQAQGAFSSNSYHQVNSDLISGTAGGSTWGSNAVVLSISSNVTHSVDPVTGYVTLSSTVSFAGNFGDPTADNSYYDLLVSDGINSSSSFELSNITWNDQQWDFTTQVRIWSEGSGRLYRDEFQTMMDGSFYSHVYAEGAIPRSSHTSVWQVNEPHPNGVFDFYIHHYTDWTVVAERRLVPSPGALALTGLGSIIALRRRRSN